MAIWQQMKILLFDHPIVKCGYLIIVLVSSILFFTYISSLKPVIIESNENCIIHNVKSLRDVIMDYCYDRVNGDYLTVYHKNLHSTVTWNYVAVKKVRKFLKLCFEFLDCGNYFHQGNSNRLPYISIFPYLKIITTPSNNNTYLLPKYGVVSNETHKIYVDIETLFFIRSLIC